MLIHHLKESLPLNFRKAPCLGSKDSSLLPLTYLIDHSKQSQKDSKVEMSQEHEEGMLSALGSSVAATGVGISRRTGFPHLALTHAQMFFSLFFTLSWKCK